MGERFKARLESYHTAPPVDTLVAAWDSTRYCSERKAPIAGAQAAVRQPSKTASGRAAARQGGNSPAILSPAERVSCALGMLSSLEVKVLRPT
jgi:hypothetical protein